MARILMVEDDNSIVMGLKFCLEQEGFQVYTASCGQDAITLNKPVDLVLLDLNLPDMHGFEVLKTWKDKAPVICLTACDEEVLIVQGLDMGAYDYVTKPFKTRELISRMKNILKREKKEDSSFLLLGNLQIDVTGAKVTKNNKEIFLTAMEYKILLMLAMNPRRAFTREEILAYIWDVNEVYVNDNTLTVYIKRIRNKLDDKEGKFIQTVRGIGYKVVE